MRVRNLYVEILSRIARVKVRSDAERVVDVNVGMWVVAKVIASYYGGEEQYLGECR